MTITIIALAVQVVCLAVIIYYYRKNKRAVKELEELSINSFVNTQIKRRKRIYTFVPYYYNSYECLEHTVKKVQDDGYEFKEMEDGMLVFAKYEEIKEQEQ